MQILIVATLAGFILIAGILSYWNIRKMKTDLMKREKEMSRRMYELAILKELGERMGYSLNVQNIIDIITGSLHQFIEYSVVSYMLLKPESIIFKANIEKSISKEFIDEVRERMIKSLSALLEKDFKKMPVEEVISGAILAEDVKDKVSSFFNIPLVIAGRLVGVLTVAHTQAGLYKEEEMTILYKITSQASQAVTRLQEVVETEQRKLNAMVESMAEGVVMTDTDYRVVVVNPAAKKAVGLEDKNELTIFDFIDRLGGKFDIRGKLEESIKLDKVLLSDEVLMADRFFQIVVSPVKANLVLQEGKALGGVVLFRDITKEKEVEKIRRDFTSMIAHELRSPLDAIKKITELMKMMKLKESQKKEYIQLIYSSSTDLLNLVNNLLDAAKIEAGKFEIFKKPSNLSEITKDRLNFFKTSAKNGNVKLALQLGKDLPESLMLDPFRIAQVLNNLLSNALKFTKSGGTVSLQAIFHKTGESLKSAAEKENISWLIEDSESLLFLRDSVLIAVTDEGAGIPKEKIGQLFSKFRQFTEASAEKTGTGLGLAIVKGIVEAHQGTVGVFSKEDAGSTFYFTIPVNT